MCSSAECSDTSDFAFMITYHVPLYAMKIRMEVSRDVTYEGKQNGTPFTADSN